jgi:hypothetical protein
MSKTKRKQLLEELGYPALGTLIGRAILFLVEWFIQNRFDEEIHDFIILTTIVFLCITGLLLWINTRTWMAKKIKKYLWVIALILLLPYALFLGFYWGKITSPGSQILMGWLPTIEYIPEPTYTKEPTYTPLPTCIPTQTPIPSPTPETTTPTPTTAPYFYDDFTYPDTHPWDLSETPHFVERAQSVKLDIENGKLDAHLFCEGDWTNVCQVNITIPTSPLSNFDIIFDTTFKELTYGGVGLTTSSLGETEAITFIFTTEPSFLYVRGFYAGDENYDGTEEKEHVYSINPSQGDQNEILISFMGDGITAKVNGSEVYHLAGRTISDNNLISLVTFSTGNNHINVLFDNLYVLPNEDSPNTD